MSSSLPSEFFETDNYTGLLLEQYTRPRELTELQQAVCDMHNCCDAVQSLIRVRNFFTDLRTFRLVCRHFDASRRAIRIGVDAQNFAKAQRLPHVCYNEQPLHVFRDADGLVRIMQIPLYSLTNTNLRVPGSNELQQQIRNLLLDSFIFGSKITSKRFTARHIRQYLDVDDQQLLRVLKCMANACQCEFGIQRDESERGRRYTMDSVFVLKLRLYLDKWANVAPLPGTTDADAWKLCELVNSFLDECSLHRLLLLRQGNDVLDEDKARVASLAAQLRLVYGDSYVNVIPRLWLIASDSFT